MVLPLFVVVVVVGCVLALSFGAAALSPARRLRVLARYPLQITSWIIATPFFAFSAFWAFLGVGSGFDEDTGGGFALGLIAGVICGLCVLAVVMCSRAARGKFARGPRTPAVLGFVAPLAIGWPLGFTGGTGPIFFFALLLSAGAGVNGLLAVQVNRGRRDGAFAVRPDATLPPVVPSSP